MKNSLCMLLMESELDYRLKHIEKVIKASVDTMPMQSEYIAKHCAAVK